MWSEIASQSRLSDGPDSRVPAKRSDPTDDWPTLSTSFAPTAAASTESVGAAATTTTAAAAAAATDASTADDTYTLDTAAVADAPAALPPSSSFWAGKQCGEVIVLESGLVMIKGAVTPVDQVLMAEAAMQRGQMPDPHGFYNSAGSLNSTKTRGRIYDAIDKFDPRYRDLCKHVVEMVRA